MSEQQTAHVLIVDDMPINRMILSSLLASNGVKADLAESGQECLEFCRNGSYDLVLMDHRMPDMDGVETFMQLKEIFQKSGRDVPVICHTTEDARKNISLYKAAGFADVLIKPIQVQQLSELLKTYLPENSLIDEESLAVKKRRLEKELSVLPDWLTSVPGLDSASGIEHCGSSEDFLEALSIFASSVQKKASEIENFVRAKDWQPYTLRIHSLKSVARLVGAEELAEAAASLEFAGKLDDIDTLISKTPAFLTDYRAFGPALSELIINDSDTADKDAAISFSNPGAEKTLLLIDDDSDYLRIMVKWLGMVYNVYGVHSGAEALRYLENGQPDLILLDYGMPGLDGYQIIKQIRENPLTSDIPIIFLSGKTDRESVMSIVHQNPDGYLTKSGTKEEILDTLERFFKDHMLLQNIPH